jgi:hypothetical protein
MKRTSEHTARQRAGGFCEYCRLPESISHLPFPLDHIVARQHGGRSTEDNLALSCPECNFHKGPNLTGIDPKTKIMTRLFNPRIDNWNKHFRWDGAILVGRTAIGRTTEYVIAANAPTRVALRAALMQAGLFPRDSKISK